MSIFRNLLLVFVLLAVAGCAPSIPVTGSPASSVETSIPKPTLPTVTLTPTLEPSLTPLPLPTATSYTPFKAVTLVDYVNVRTNPGLLFPVKMTVSKGTTFTVYGKTPEGDWIYVLAQDNNTNGWVYTSLLKSDRALSTPPIKSPDNVQLISGLVLDENGNHISGITFAIVQGNVRSEVMTGMDGAFNIYLPLASSGQWTISYNGIDCSSNLMDSSCNCKAAICGEANPPNINVQLPVSKPLKFLWK